MTKAELVRTVVQRGVTNSRAGRGLVCCFDRQVHQVIRSRGV